MHIIVPKDFNVCLLDCQKAAPSLVDCSSSWNELLLFHHCEIELSNVKVKKILENYQDLLCRQGV